MAGTAQEIARLSRAFPRQAVPEETFKVYLAELAGLPDDLLERAVTEIIRTQEWFPTIAAVLATAAELALLMPDETGALMQVERIIQWRRDGADQAARPEIHPLVVAATRAVGGYAAFRSSTNPGVVHGQFLKAYREARAVAIRDFQVGGRLELESAPSPGWRREISP